ncbi:MAG: hypothetical protein K6C69_01715 [Lachnospiraceae bacterium]|nr:hypothetical protein [Lachnospiraceae bacterium]
MLYIVYNPLSNNGSTASRIADATKLVVGEKEYIDVTKVNLKEFYGRLKKKDKVVLCGGDGTIHHFVNELYGEPHRTSCYFMPLGSGNDFARDMAADYEDGMIEITPYMDSLPTVRLYRKPKPETENIDRCKQEGASAQSDSTKKFDTSLDNVKDQNTVSDNSTEELEVLTMHFVNNVAFGLDGYCCERSDELKKKHPGKKINYSLIALGGILGRYQNTNGKVRVDGVEKEYTNILMAPTMNGRYYGGGVMVAPGQDRKNMTGKLTLVVAHGMSPARVLTILPQTYSGKHVKNTDYVEILEGYKISVEYDRPSPVQVDGETVLDVVRYEVESCGVGPLFVDQLPRDN